MKSIVISKNEEGLKLIKFLKNIFNEMPNSLLYKLLRKKYFKINNKKADGTEILKNNDKLFIFLSDDTFDKFYVNNDLTLRKNKFSDSEDNDIDKYINNRIIYEDDNIIIYNKPVGLLSQNDSHNDLSVNTILYNYVMCKNIKSNSECLDGTYKFRPSIVNRLDRNTSGIIIFAKTYIASRLLYNMIKDNNIEKHYITIVNGTILEDSGELINLYRKDSKTNKAIIKEFNNEYNNNLYSVVKLKYKVLARTNDSTLLDINLITGKSHQIRAQLSYINHPIICDRKYMDLNTFNENVSKYKINHQKLMCYNVKFGMIEDERMKYLSNREFKLDVDEESFLFVKNNF